jgi:hypothetical protein
LTDAASAQKMTTLIFKDISWLWRTAYNSAVQGCSEWENAGEQISELFDIAREVIAWQCGQEPFRKTLFSDINSYSYWKHLAMHRQSTLTPICAFTWLMHHLPQSLDEVRF